MRNLNLDQPLRPAQYVEKILVTSILDGTYPIGMALPNERRLAELIGITRPTLREILQRLANEGWIKIHHGKPTVVNDYWQEGGLSLLSTLAKYGDYLPNGFITHLLEVRMTMLPPLAKRAATNHPKIIMNYLDTARTLDENAEAFSNYDWKLQMLMARHSKNPVFSLILNDFTSIFKIMALRYFSMKIARQASRTYYRELSRAIEQSGEAVANVVKKAMEQSIDIWHKVKSFSG
jgi:GntR family negative regulator for fad regulon and positive regulator of fabA